LKIKLKDLHFDTTEVIEAESQVVLKKGRSTENSANKQQGTISWVMVASKPKVSF
jgi:hypothetical protein